jgi:hypothetical protein
MLVISFIKEGCGHGSDKPSQFPKLKFEVICWTLKHTDLLLLKWLGIAKYIKWDAELFLSVWVHHQQKETLLVKSLPGKNNVNRFFAVFFSSQRPLWFMFFAFSLSVPLLSVLCTKCVKYEDGSIMWNGWKICVTAYYCLTVYWTASSTSANRLVIASLIELSGTKTITSDIARMRSMTMMMLMGWK